MWVWWVTSWTPARLGNEFEPRLSKECVPFVLSLRRYQQEGAGKLYLLHDTPRRSRTETQFMEKMPFWEANEKFSVSYRPRKLISMSTESATDAYPELDNSTRHPHTWFLWRPVKYIIIYPSTPGSITCSSPFRFSAKCLFVRAFAVCMDAACHLLTIFVQCKLWSSSL